MYIDIKSVKRTAAALAMLLVFAAAAPAGQPLTCFQDARSLALGRADLILQPSLAMGWNNPALAAKSGFRIYFPAYQFRTSTTTFKIFKFIRDNSERFANLENLPPEEQQAFYDDMEPFDDQYVDVNNDFGIGFYIKGFGLLLQAQTGMGVKLDRGIYTPMVGLKGRMIVGLTLSYGMAISESEAVGFSLTPLWGKQLQPARFSAGDLSDATAAQSKFWDALGDSSLAMGFSTSFGYCRQLKPGMRVCAAVTDLFGSFDGEPYKLQLTAGISGTLASAMPTDIWLARRVTWLASWEDIFNLNGRNLFSRLHFGSEIDLFPLYLRGGINQGYLTGGIGLRFKVINLDYTIYGEETGRKPGLGQQYAHVIQLKLGWE